MAKKLACACGWKAKTPRGLDAHLAKNWCGRANEKSSGGRSAKSTALDRMSTKSIKCPSCGRPMIIRVARRGRVPGHKFYGCTGFPVCKHTLSIDDVPTPAPPRNTPNRRPSPQRVEKPARSKEAALTHPAGNPRAEPIPREAPGTTDQRAERTPHFQGHTEKALEPVSAARKALVADAVKTWVDELIDRTGRNRLLYYRHLKTGTLDLQDAEPNVLDRMLQGRSVRITQLFTDPELQIDAMRRARAVEAKARENDEERGIRTLYVAFGLATWSPKLSTTTQSQVTPLPNAPVVIQAIKLNRLGYIGGDFELVIDDVPELNPVLLHVLAEEFQVDVDEDAVLDAQTLPRSRRDGTVRQLMEICDAVPGFDVKDSLIIGNFSYTKLPMVRDIEQNVEEIEQDTLLAAIAGDQEARDELRERQSSLDLDNLEPVPPPAEEFLVLDADASQSWTIAAALTGANLVIEGPPGTGKSQTIVNLIAASAARGKSVLFVAEKRAAIDAVTDRLKEVGLEQMVLDLHGGASDKRRVANDFSEALAGAREALEPDVGRIHRDLSRTRTELEDYQEQLHRQVEPWNLSVFQIQNRLLELSGVPDLGIRFDRDGLADLSGPAVEQAYENLHSFVERGGMAITGEGSDIFTSVFASDALEDAAALEEALKTLDRVVRTSLPEFSRAFRRACSSLDLESPESIDAASRCIDLLEDVVAIDAEASTEIYQADLASLSSALGPARSWARILSTVFSSAYRSARTVVREFAYHPDLEDEGLLGLVEDAASASRRWADMSLAGSRPATWPLLDELVGAVGELSEDIRSLGAAIGQDMNDLTNLEDLESIVNTLVSGRSTLLGYPGLHGLYRSLAVLGLEPVIDAVRSRGLNVESAVNALEHAWLSSVLDLLWIDLPSLSGFSRDAQDNVVKGFRLADENHINVGAARVKRMWASNSVSARDASQHESAVLVTQASLRPRSRQRLSLRKLYQETGDVLTSVKPCWVMSPLVVAQVLPAKKCFDLVIFDEASQIPPADAVPSLMRGRQTVVAGDPKQLPPTTFFASAT